MFKKIATRFIASLIACLTVCVACPVYAYNANTCSANCFNDDISYSAIDHKVVTIVTTPIDSTTKTSAHNIYTCEKNVDIKIYKGRLDANQVENTGFSAASLTRSDEDENSMGNIRAKLSVTYKKGNIDGSDSLTLLTATSSYKTLLYEGVVPKTSELYYNVEGAIYKNEKFIKNKMMGFTKKYNSPTFRSVALMGSSYAVSPPTTAGVRYTLYCTRGVTIKVFVRFA